jgi:formylglycine-generating enzyme required for sulfatase activity
LLTTEANWTAAEQRMMQRAARYHALRVAAVSLLVLLLTYIGLNAHHQGTEQQNSTQASALVRRLLDAETAQVPGIIADIEKYRRWADPILRDEFDKAPVESRQKLHAGLALLPVDASQVPFLCARLLTAEPQEVRVIRDTLASHKDEVSDTLWSVAQTPEKGKETQRLRAASALAAYEPAGDRWTNVKKPLADDLVNVPAVYLALWIDALRPVRGLLLPSLGVIFRDPARRDVERSLATDILADYAADDPQTLADLLMDADDRQFAVLYPKFKERADAGLSALKDEIDRKLPADAKDDDVERLAKRQANAAVVLLKLGKSETVWPLLAHAPDPRRRSYLIHRLSPLGADPKALIQRLDSENEASIRRALLLGLGRYGENDLSADMRTALLPKLHKIYQEDADPGLHAASEWLLRTWKQDAWLSEFTKEWMSDRKKRQSRQIEIRNLVTTKKAKASPQWYVNGQGQTMVVIPGPVEFLMGEPDSSYTQHKKRINRSFSIAATAVTLEQFRRFEEQNLAAAFERSPDLPVLGIDWYRAARYCNWLSEKEEIPKAQWCYEIKGDDVRLKANYLSLSGYRLPTESEMEYATRAGATTARYFGETDELLPNYEWYVKNSQECTWPVGTRIPNDLGLFDTQGNVLIWCQEQIQEYPKTKDASEDKEDALDVDPIQRRVVRGGAFDLRALNIRSAQRLSDVPGNSNHNLGFRIARTIPPG